MIRKLKSASRMSSGIPKNPARKGNTPVAATVPAPAPAPAPLTPAAPAWTFLTNHAHVLILLAAEGSVPLRIVAARVGITERAVQRIVAELESGGVLVRERVGRNNRYQVQRTVRLRHPIEAHRTVGDLLDMVHGG
jgi:hypothetical protein